MAEYIERENAIAWFVPYAHAGESIDADVVISDIKGMKAADVAAVGQQWHTGVYALRMLRMRLHLRGKQLFLLSQLRLEDGR